MNRNERWLSSITLIVGVLPLILIGLVQSFVGSPFLYVDLATRIEYQLTAAQMRFIGLFSIVPVIIVFVARILRTRGLIQRNFKIIVIATLVMCCMYILVIVWILYLTMRRMDVTVVFKRINYASLVCTIVSLTFCSLSNFLPDLKPNPIFGVKNSKTSYAPEIWERVNSAASSVLTYLFLACSVLTAYTRHPISAVSILVVSIFIYYLWVLLYSRYAYTAYIRDKEKELCVPLPEPPNDDNDQAA